MLFLKLLVDLACFNFHGFGAIDLCFYGLFEVVYFFLDGLFVVLPGVDVIFILADSASICFQSISQI